MPVSEDLVAQLGQQYDHLKRPCNENFFRAVLAHLAHLTGQAVLAMYLEFALSTNDRGRNVAKIIERFSPLSGKRFLDVGCAYCGFLVAFAEKGAIVAGVEMEEAVLRLGHINLRDHSLDARTVLGDITDPSISTLFQDTDIITCNDVIEHVKDPMALANTISQMLAPNGVAYLEIPNRNFPYFVIEDGHYKLFGITLLEYPDAERYYLSLYPEKLYRTYYYLELSEYQSLFENAGLRLTLLDESFLWDEYTIHKHFAQLRQASPGALGTVPPQTRAPVAYALERYIDNFQREAGTPEFMPRYGTDFWRVIATRIP